MSDVLKTLGEMGVVPVVTINEPEHAVPVAKALVAGGLPAAEITFRTAAAEGGIRLAAAAVPEALLGAGTVLNIEQARRAVAAGARFLVAPGLNPEDVARLIVTVYAGTRLNTSADNGEQFLDHMAKNWNLILPAISNPERLGYLTEFIRRRTAHLSRDWKRVESDQS